jgi:hypothetical protein
VTDEQTEWINGGMKINRGKPEKLGENLAIVT